MRKFLASSFIVVVACALVAALILKEQSIERRLIGVTAECNNGRYTTAERGRGVCSANGGVKRWVE